MQRMLASMVDHREQVVAIGGLVADAKGQRFLGTSGPARLGIAALDADHPAAEVLSQNEVDDTSDCIAAVDRRGAVPEHFDPVDRRQRNDMQIDADSRVVAEGVVGHAAPVQEDQGRPRAEAAQRCP